MHILHSHFDSTPNSLIHNHKLDYMFHKQNFRQLLRLQDNNLVVYIFHSFVSQYHNILRRIYRITNNHHQALHNNILLQLCILKNIHHLIKNKSKLNEISPLISFESSHVSVPVTIPSPQIS